MGGALPCPSGSGWQPRARVTCVPSAARFHLTLGAVYCFTGIDISFDDTIINTSFDYIEMHGTVDFFCYGF